MLIISEWLNRITVYNKAVLHDAVERRRKDQALVTVSNHRSCFDDPVLFGNNSILFYSVHFSSDISHSFLSIISLSLAITSAGIVFVLRAASILPGGI